MTQEQRAIPGPSQANQTRKLLVLGSLWVFGLAGLAGGVCLVQGVWMLLKVNRSSDWPSVKGEILVSKAVSRGTPSRATTRLPSWELRYRYTVDGTSYSGQRASYGGIDMSRLEHYLATYPKGRVVDVYYNPDSPQQAVLDTRSTDGGGWVLIVVGVVIWGVCAVLAKIFLGLLKTPRPEE